MASSPRPSPARPESPVYHIVPHTHWDREWYRPFEVFRARLVQCIDALLDILKRDPSFSTFMLDGQASVLEDYCELRPDRKRELAAHIQSGRIATGPWYTLPDEFLVSGEGLIRNLLLGRARAKEFGHCMNVGYVPDSFGHAAAMPAIFRGFGVQHAVTWRGFGGEEGQNIAEWIWRSPDGSNVTMHHLHRDGYSAATFHGLTPRAALQRFRHLQKRSDERATTRHRLLLSGGDHHFPDPELPSVIRSLRTSTGADIRMSSLEKFFKGIDAEHPLLNVLHGELHYGYRNAFVVSSGVYSSRVILKQENRRIQRLYERYVEPLLALGMIQGVPVDRALLQRGWRELLRNHAHDSICGCSIDAVHDEMRTRFAKAEQIGNELIRSVMDKLAPGTTGARRDDKSIMVFNPSASIRSGCATCAVELYLQDVVVGLNPDVEIAAMRAPAKGLRITDAQGKRVRFQITNRAEAFGFAESRYDYPAQSRVDRIGLLVETRTLPSLAWSSFSVASSARGAASSSRLRVRGRTMENDSVRITVRRDGTLDIVDKKSGQLFPGVHRFEDGGDVGDEYSYSPPQRDRAVTSGTGAARVKVLERGPLRATLEVRCALRIPVSAATNRQSRSRSTSLTEIVTRVSLYERSPIVHFETRLTNVSRDHRLRVVFPAPITSRNSYADQHFGVVRRAHEEFNPVDFSIEHPSPVHPMHRFVTVQDAHLGVTLYSDGQPEYEWHPRGKFLALTLLRCVGQLSGSDLITRPGGDAGWKNATPGAQCIGEQTFRYAMFAHAPDDWESVQRPAEEYHTPFLTITRTHRAKNIPGLFGIDHPAIVLSSVKPSERGGALIVRFYNSADTTISCRLRFNRKVRKVSRTRLDETANRPCPLVHSATELRLAAGEIVTLRLSLSRSRRAD